MRRLSSAGGDCGRGWRIAPDIAGVLLAGLSGPQAVVAETVKKIAARVGQGG